MMVRQTRLLSRVGLPDTGQGFAGNPAAAGPHQCLKPLRISPVCSRLASHMAASNCLGCAVRSLPTAKPAGKRYFSGPVNIIFV
jgi:hypothetical protein